MEPDRTVDPIGRPIERRRFVRLLLGWSIVSTLSIVVAPVIGFLIPPRQPAAAGGRLLVGTTDDIGPGRSKVVALGAKPVIVLNSPQGMKAFSAVCTHLGCIVGYDASKNPGHRIPVPRQPLQYGQWHRDFGPPPAPLKEYRVAVEKNQVYVQDS